jgi:hypothetical protein
MQDKSKSLEQDMTRMTILGQLKPKLTNLAQGLTPDGSGTLMTADKGASVVLPAGADTSLQAQLQAAALSLPTQQRYLVTSETFSPSGALISPYNTFHIASPTEMTDIANGTKGTTSGPFGGTLTTSTVTASNGSQTIYAYDANAQYTVASLADLKNLQTTVANAQPVLENIIQGEMQDLKAASARMLQIARLDQWQSAALHEQGSAVDDQEHDQRRHDKFDTSRVKQMEVTRVLQHDAKSPPPVDAVPPADLSGG